MRSGKNFIYYRIGRLRKAEVRSRKVKRRLVENTDDEFFAVDGGQTRNTEIEFFAADDEVDTTVLWLTTLGNIHSRHDFQTGADCRVRLYGKLCALLQRTVDTVTYADDLFKRFDMNVAGAVRNRFFNDRVDQPDGGIVDYVLFFKRYDLLNLAL